MAKAPVCEGLSSRYRYSPDVAYMMATGKKWEPYEVFAEACSALRAKEKNNTKEKANASEDQQSVR